LSQHTKDLRADLTADVLGRLKNCSPEFFERLVVEVLVKMGYGGSRTEAGEAIGASGDEGIDGIINEDRLGLDVIYLQAKRRQGTVGRPKIQKFVGALHGKRAKKGIFITTGTFSTEALDFVSKIESKVFLAFLWSAASGRRTPQKLARATRLPCPSPARLDGRLPESREASIIRFIQHPTSNLQFLISYIHNHLLFRPQRLTSFFHRVARLPGRRPHAYPQN